MTPDKSNSSQIGQSVIEYALILLLIAIVILAILLILGDDLRAFVFDLLQTWFPEQIG
jgi:Flp pilus assembly pilin Flp